MTMSIVGQLPTGMSRNTMTMLMTTSIHAHTTLAMSIRARTIMTTNIHAGTDMSMSTPDLEQFRKQRLREAGLRATPSRLAVLELLDRSSVPLSHGEVVQVFRAKPWDRATLYRNLLDLVRGRLARRIDVGDRIWRFEIATPHPHDTSHPHFVCTTCKQISCMPGIDLRVIRSEDIPKTVQNQEIDVEIRGLCDICRSRSKR